MLEKLKCGQWIHSPTDKYLLGGRGRFKGKGNDIIYHSKKTLLKIKGDIVINYPRVRNTNENFSRKAEFATRLTRISFPVHVHSITFFCIKHLHPLGIRNCHFLAWHNFDTKEGKKK